MTVGSARDLLARGNLLQVPVDVYAVAAFCNLQIYPSDDLPDKVSGLLYRGPARDVIVVNARHSLARRRFTIGHEIGHWHFRNERISFKGIHREHRSDLEQLVDHFSAELLMPAEPVQLEWSRGRGVRSLARQFVVSRDAMRRRLQELELLSA